MKERKTCPYCGYDGVVTIYQVTQGVVIVLYWICPKCGAQNLAGEYENTES